MKSNRISIQINKPSIVVFSFYIDPKNTPLWVDSIVEEKTDSWPIGLGTIYINKSPEGTWSNYSVTALKPGELFELTSENGNYHVRYTHKDLSDITSELEYHEWVDSGHLDDPFTLSSLNKLKNLVENNG